jgi:transposase
MSLKPRSIYAVPEQTASVARAAYPGGSLCIRIFDELGTIFQDQDFADLYSQCGQPGQPPFRLALATVLQFIEGLSDRGAADAVRGRIDWKYLLCLELDDPGFDHSVLCEFRARLLEGGAERILFDKILSALRDKKLVKPRTAQRTDSTHVLAAVRDLNRVERVGETLHATLNVLAVAAPEWVRINIPEEWVDRYGKLVDEWRLPEKEKNREIYIRMVGQDGAALLDALWSEESPGWMRSLPAVETLRCTWVQQFMVVEGVVLLRPNDGLPPSSIRIDSPYDTQARFAYKRSTKWLGYKVHLTETCDEETPNIITNVQTECATFNDNYSLPKIHEQLSQAELLPDKHLVDAGYIEASNLVESRREYGIDLIGPAQNNGRWQQVQGNGFDISHFQVDWDREKVICPAGRENSSWRPMVDSRGNNFIHAAFARSDCSVCVHLSQCTSAKGRRRTINLRPKELHEALQQNRRREKNKEFKEEYSDRAGIEGTISQGVRAFGLRRSRYIGMAKTRLQHLATAAAINLERVSDWLAGIDREKTRRSAFARAMQPLVA